MTQREARLHLHRARGEAAFVHMGTLRRPPSRHPHRPKAAWISSTQGLERELGHSPRAAALHFFTPCWFQGHEAAQAGANWALSPTSPDVQHTCNAHVGTGKARCVWSFSCLVLAITSVTYSLPRHADALKLYLQCLCQHRVQRRPPRKPSALWANSLPHRRALLFAHFVPCFHVCPELGTTGFKSSQDTPRVQTANLAFLLPRRYFHSCPTDSCHASQERQSVIIHKGCWLLPPRGTAISEVGLCSSLFEL